MKKILIVIFMVLVLGLSFYFYINTKVNKEDLAIITPPSQEDWVRALEQKGGARSPTSEDWLDYTEKISEIDSKNINNNQNNKQMTKATFNTTKGNFTIEFFPNLAPKTVENFTKLASEGFYNNTKFHRVIKGFMNQGGDPLSKDDSLKSSWGTGGPGYKFADEISEDNKNDIGTISMANSGANTNGSQFFINVANNNFLDPKHTVFGKVVEGMDVIMNINNVATDPSDKPLEAVVIKSITLN